MIYLATDHAGFYLKEKIKIWLEEWGYEYKDSGAYEYNEADDYPDFIIPAVKRIKKRDRGIILGGSGQGEAMVANRQKEIRAAVYYGGCLEIVSLSREHNDANVLSLGVRFLTEIEARKAVKLWLETKFTKEEKHQRRIKKIDP